MPESLSWPDPKVISGDTFANMDIAIQKLILDDRYVEYRMICYFA